MIDHWKKIKALAKPHKCQGCLLWIEKGQKSLKATMGAGGVTYHFYVHDNRNKYVDAFEKRREPQ